MLFLYTCVVSRNCVCLGCTTLGGDQTATVDLLLRGLLATCRNDSLCFLCVVEDCTVLFTQRGVIKNFFWFLGFFGYTRALDICKQMKTAES